MKMLSLHRFLLLAVLLLAVSCGSQRTYQYTEPTSGLGKYVILEIPDFKTQLTYVPPDASWRLPNGIADRLTKQQLFAGVSRSPVNIKDKVLVMQGTIVKYMPKKWYEQAVFSTTVGVYVRLIDKTDNKLVAEASFEASSKGGALSGGVPFAYIRLVDEVVEYLRSNYVTNK